MPKTQQEMFGSAHPLTPVFQDIAAQANLGAHVILVGAGDGHAACALMDAIRKSGKEVLVDACDAQWTKRDYDDVLATLLMAGHLAKMQVYRMNSERLYRLYPAHQVDAIVIAAHASYNALRTEIALALMMLKPGGLLAGRFGPKAAAGERAFIECLGDGVGTCSDDYWTCEVPKRKLELIL